MNDRLADIEQWVANYNSQNIRKAGYISDIEWLIEEVKQLRMVHKAAHRTSIGELNAALNGYDAYKRWGPPDKRT